jgi:hypothetical protein
MSQGNILQLLRGGDRRMIGRADQVAATVSKHPELFPELIAGLWATDPLICMRAADAVEKVTRTHSDLLQRYKTKLLALMGKAKQQELRWHLTLVVPRLRLSAKELKVAMTSLNDYLEDKSSIVKTCALQGCLIWLKESQKSEARLWRFCVELRGVVHPR